MQGSPFASWETMEILHTVEAGTQQGAEKQDTVWSLLYGWSIMCSIPCIIHPPPVPPVMKYRIRRMSIS